MIEAVCIIALSLVFVVQTFNLGTWVILRHIAGSAVDQSVRAGTRLGADPVGACQERGTQVLGGALEQIGAVLECGADAEQVTARAFIPLPSWLPGIPDSSTEVAAVARREREP